MNPEQQNTGTPLWLKVTAIVCALPVLAMPWLLAGHPETDTAKTLLWLYPAFVVLDAICAVAAWNRGRELTVILLVLMLLTHAAMWILCYPPQ